MQTSTIHQTDGGREEGGVGGAHQRGRGRRHQIQPGPTDPTRREVTDLSRVHVRRYLFWKGGRDLFSFQSVCGALPILCHFCLFRTDGGRYLHKRGRCKHRLCLTKWLPLSFCLVRTVWANIRLSDYHHSTGRSDINCMTTGKKGPGRRRLWGGRR